MSTRYPFTDSPAKQEIAQASDHGRATGDWTPLLNRMNTALHNDELDGPFFFHARMRIYGKEAYNWCIVQVERQSQQWLGGHLARMGGFEAIQRRYVEFYGTAPQFPNHLPARILGANEDGNAGSPSNVSWFLDQYLPDIGPHDLDRVCGLELISSWDARFDLIYSPACEQWLDAGTVKTLRDLQGGLPLGAVATLAAIVHEAGHALGSQASIPALPRFTEHMPKIWFGAMGELNTDIASLAFLHDLAPPLTAFVLLFRLAGNAGRGNPDEATIRRRLNKNYDCLASTVMFERLRKAGALVQRSERWRIDFEAVPAVAREFLTDLDRLGHELNRHVAENRPERVRPTAAEFFARDLEVDDEGQWRFPDAQRAVIERLKHIPRSPTWADMGRYYTLQSQIDPQVWAIPTP